MADEAAIPGHGPDWPDEPRRRSPEELNLLARRIVTNEVFFTNTEEGYKNSFGALLMLAPPPIPYAEKTGGMYEELSKASPRSVNGFPMFLSAVFLHIDDLGPLLDLIAKKEAALS